MVDITLHQGLVKRLAKKYARNKEELEELVSEGNIGLVVAGKKYDDSKGVKFSTYAYYWVKQYMLRYINSSDLGVDEHGLPVSLVEHEEWMSHTPFNKGVEDSIFCEQLFELAKLSEREKAILQLRFYENLNTSEIANYYGLTNTRILQLIEVALLKLRKVVNYG